MGLYRRKDSQIWWMGFSYEKQQFQRSTGTEDEKVAKEILTRLQAKIALNMWHPETLQKEEVKEYTFRELTGKYRDWIKGRQKSAKWKRYVIDQLLEKFGDMGLNTFDTQILEQFQSDRLCKGKHKVKVGKNEWRHKPNKPATVNRLIAVISHMFTKAVDWKMMSKETVVDINVKMLPENNWRLRYLSKEECEALINACDPYLKPIVITALHTGMRKSEILTLTWDNLDLKHNFILLDVTKNGERREIPINDTLKATLQGLTRRLDIPFVFCNPATGKPYQKDLKKSFHTALKKAGIRDFKFHDTRHTFASQLVMSGVDITSVKELLGHKSLTMTLRYAHLAPAHKVKAVKILDNALTGKYYDFMTVRDSRERHTG